MSAVERSHGVALNAAGGPEVRLPCITGSHFVVRPPEPGAKLRVMKLKDQVAIVTGGASGIGAASARLFAAEGAKVVLVDLDEVGLGQVAADIEAKGGQALTIPADVSSDQQARAGVEQVMEKWGRIDVLLTAAGASTGGTVDTIEEAAWDRTFAINVKGTYLWIHYAIAPMIAARSGAIVTIGSQLAQSSPGKNAAYIASKGAIASFTKTMAVDHASQGIRVNALMPGVIDTPMPARSLKRYADPEAMRTFWKHRHPMGRIGQPEEVAKAALFLACEDSSFITGTLLFVDGGWTAH
jgi:NAD(P)-dependent dehydrogenase (short-subunit alcohol dehydrogenase family)